MQFLHSRSFGLSFQKSHHEQTSTAHCRLKSCVPVSEFESQNRLLTMQQNPNLSDATSCTLKAFLCRCSGWSDLICTSEAFHLIRRSGTAGLLQGLL